MRRYAFLCPTCGEYEATTRSAPCPKCGKEGQRQWRIYYAASTHPTKGR